MVAIIAWGTELVLDVIRILGYPGIVLLMGLESACIPIPSELIMPFSGKLVADGELAFWPVTFAGALGCALGSALAYGVGYFVGRPTILRYGKYILVTRGSLEWAERWFAKYGDVTAYFSRFLPVIRTFISLPAGAAKSPFWPFIAYSFLGSVPWCGFLTLLGMKLGEHWDTLSTYFHILDVFVIVGILAGMGYYVYKVLGEMKKEKAESAGQGPEK